MRFLPHQPAGIAFLREQKRAILADEPGLGKTIQALVAAQLDGALRILYVAPAHILWRINEMASEWSGYGRVMFHGGGRELPSVDTSEMIVFTSYELATAHRDELLAVGFDLVIVDEAHHVKERKAKVLGALRPLSRKARRLYLLTGTPVLNTADEMWPLLNLIDPVTWSSYWRFVDTYCLTSTVYAKGGRPIRQVDGPDPAKLAELKARLAHILLRREQTLEPVVPVRTALTLSGPERAAYDQLAAMYFLDTATGPVIADHDAALVLRLRQLASDWQLLDPTLGVGTKVAAATASAGNLHRQGEPVVMFASFKATVHRIAAALVAGGVEAVAIDGDVTPHRRRSAIASFQSGDVRALVGTYGAMSEGVDMYAARHIIRVDQDWVPKTNDQAVGRVRRIGQTRQVYDHTFHITGTVDDRVEEALRDKRKVIDAILGRKLKEVL